MVDIEIIKENYKRMSDDQLIRFAKLEANNLPLTSFHALKDELISRDIDLQVIEELEDIDIPERKINNEVISTFLSSLINHAIDLKFSGAKNFEIYHALLAKNLLPEKALMLIQMLPELTYRYLKSIKKEITISWIMFFIGLLLFTYSLNEMNFSFFVGIFISISASVKLANSYPTKRKIEQVILNFKSDSESEITELYQ